MSKLSEITGLNIQDIATVKPRQVPVCLCVDCSYSMKVSGKIQQINESIRKFIERNANDTNVCDNLMMCIIAYGGDKPRVVQEFTNVQNIQFKDLVANGATPLGEAVNLSIEKINEIRSLLREEGTPLNKPLLFIFGDGKATFSDGKAMKDAVKNVKSLVASHKLKVQCVGVKKKKKEDLQKFCPGQEIKSFNQFEIEKIFDMLSRSITGASTELGDSDWDNVLG